MIYEIWVEGYWATGNGTTAQLAGEQEADSFGEAVQAFFTTERQKQWGGLTEQNGRFRVWGRRVFDNEADARKAFG